MSSGVIKIIFESFLLDMGSSRPTNYDPVLPWVSKMKGKVEANDLKVYVDDVRPYGSSEQGFRRTRTHASKITQYLGQQDAARKYRPPSKKPGPWCGSFVSIKDGNV